MNRLKKTLQKAKTHNEKLLAIFVTAGYPKLDSTPKLVWTLENAGADVVEIGLPFSDPIADGPTIQNSSQVAIRNGINIKTILKQIQMIRSKCRIPIILMGYVNLLFKYGIENLMQEAEEVGVDGLIIPDLSPEEYLVFKNKFNEKNLGVNFLISPNTPRERIKFIDNLTSEFIYCVSVTGVTGSRKGVPPRLIDFLQSLKSQLHHPYLVGFGVSNPGDARIIARHSHGVIIGSAIINLMEQYKLENEMLKAVSNFVQEIKFALTGV